MFSHQLGVINELSKYFKCIHVLVPHSINYSNDLEHKVTNKFASNIKVYQFSFQSGKRFSNAWRLFTTARQLVSVNSIDSVMYFMTDSYAAVLSPYFRSKKVRQVLWYAHAHRPFKLIFAKFFLNAICSSTSGSIPLKDKKVHLIGQMVDEKLFPFVPVQRRYLSNFVHVGRFDPSKNIAHLIEVVVSLNRNLNPVSIEFRGCPSNPKSEKYIHDLKLKYGDQINSNILTFKPQINRIDLSNFYRYKGIFVHAFQGSLDKSLVEATLSGLPVATVNKEYVRIFGYWSERPDDLLQEVQAILDKAPDLLQLELLRRRSIALENHTLAKWGYKMADIINGDSLWH